MIEETLEQACKRLEFFETPRWAAEAILRREIMTQRVVDPCCGTGILCDAALAAGYDCTALDINDWGYRPKNDGDDKVGVGTVDFLGVHDGYLDGYDLNTGIMHGYSIFMNPPFSKAVEFVEKSLALGARKIICFQRFSWWESQGRRAFWEKTPPNRVYICGNRADCWRHDIPADQRGSSSPTAHAWFIWEQGHPPGTQLSHIWKEDARLEP